MDRIVNDGILRLNVKKRWYDLLKAGEKDVEYREMKKYWLTRLSNAAPIKEVHFYCGYPRGDTLPLVRKLKYIVYPPHTPSGMIELHLEAV